MKKIQLKEIADSSPYIVGVRIEGSDIEVMYYCHETPERQVYKVLNTESEQEMMKELKWFFQTKHNSITFKPCRVTEESR